MLVTRVMFDQPIRHLLNSNLTTTSKGPESAKRATRRPIDTQTWTYTLIMAPNKQHYAWAAGHFLVVLCATRYILTWVTFKSGKYGWWYSCEHLRICLCSRRAHHELICVSRSRVCWSLVELRNCCLVSLFGPQTAWDAFLMHGFIVSRWG